MTTYTYNGHSYLLSNYGTWQQAQAEAVGMGGNAHATLIALLGTNLQLSSSNFLI